ncbi:MAG: response regulator, partial [Candidatus Omnitrophica bacterium]|nr:response regulator [Candidatus Omnitrophota bacterium]
MKKLKIRFTTLLTAIAFVLNQLAFYGTSVAMVPESGIGSVSGQSLSGNLSEPEPVPRTSSFQLSIPPELGTIQEMISGNGPAIIHLETAHGNYQAQRKIQAILHYLKRRYDIDLLFVEGSAFELNPELIRFYPKRMDVTLEILDDLAKKAIVKGSELFLAEDRETRAYGIEDLKTYRANAESFKQVLIEQGKTSAFLQATDIQIKRLISPYINKDLKAFINRLEDFDRKLVPFLEWLSYLKTMALEHLDLDLSDPMSQIDWPMLVRMFKLQEIEKEMDREKFEQERDRFLKTIRRYMAGAVREPPLRISEPVLAETGLSKTNAEPIPQQNRYWISQIVFLLSVPLSHHKLPDPETGLLFENMISRLPRNFNYGAYPNVMRFIGHLVLQSELRADRLMKEIGQIQERIAYELAGTKKEKEILALLDDYRLLGRLFCLELTPADYEEIAARENSKLNDPQRIQPSAVIRRFLAINDGKRVKNVQFKHVGEIDQLFEKALDFYRGVNDRDRRMLENIEKILKREAGSKKQEVGNPETGFKKTAGAQFIAPFHLGRDQSRPDQTVFGLDAPNTLKAVIITGGFHAEPFKKYFEAHGCNYALIIPSLTSADGRQMYVRSVLEFSESEPVPTGAGLSRGGSRTASTSSTMETPAYAALSRSELRAHGIRVGRVNQEILRTSLAVLRKKRIRLDESVKTIWQKRFGLTAARSLIHGGHSLVRDSRSEVREAYGIPEKWVVLEQRTFASRLANIDLLLDGVAAYADQLPDMKRYLILSHSSFYQDRRTNLEKAQRQLDSLVNDRLDSANASKKKELTLKLARLMLGIADLYANLPEWQVQELIDRKYDVSYQEAWDDLDQAAKILSELFKEGISESHKKVIQELTRRHGDLSGKIWQRSRSKEGLSRSEIREFQVPEQIQERIASAGLGWIETWIGAEAPRWMDGILAGNTDRLRDLMGHAPESIQNAMTREDPVWIQDRIGKVQTRLQEFIAQSPGVLEVFRENGYQEPVSLLEIGDDLVRRKIAQRLFQNPVFKCWLQADFRFWPRPTQESLGPGGLNNLNNKEVHGVGTPTQTSERGGLRDTMIEITGYRLLPDGGKEPDAMRRGQNPWDALMITGFNSQEAVFAALRTAENSKDLRVRQLSKEIESKWSIPQARSESRAREEAERFARLLVSGSIHNILIVEDDPGILATYRDHLFISDYFSSPFHSEYATNGLEALRMIHESFRPDLIVTDLRMPHMTGEEMIARIRAEGIDIPIIVVSNTEPSETLTATPNLVYLKKLDQASIILLHLLRILMARSEMRSDNSRQQVPDETVRAEARSVKVTENIRPDITEDLRRVLTHPDLTGLQRHVVHATQSIFDYLVYVSTTARLILQDPSLIDSYQDQLERLRSRLGRRYGVTLYVLKQLAEAMRSEGVYASMSEDGRFFHFNYYSALQSGGGGVFVPLQGNDLSYEQSAEAVEKILNKKHENLDDHILIGTLRDELADRSLTFDDLEGPC